MSNLRTSQEIYEAFGRGHVAAILFADRNSALTEGIQSRAPGRC